MKWRKNTTKINILKNKVLNSVIKILNLNSSASLKQKQTIPSHMCVLSLTYTHIYFLQVMANNHINQPNNIMNKQ